AMNMAPFIFWNLAFYTIIRTQLIYRSHKEKRQQSFYRQPQYDFWQSLILLGFDSNTRCIETADFCFGWNC
ncbi:hypothetical protein ABNF17_20365, partial [Paenibacillus larvae]